MGRQVRFEGPVQVGKLGDYLPETSKRGFPLHTLAKGTTHNGALHSELKFRMQGTVDQILCPVLKVTSAWEVQ
jgi:hypothetical protein